MHLKVRAGLKQREVIRSSRVLISRVPTLV